MQMDVFLLTLWGSRDFYGKTISMDQKYCYYLLPEIQKHFIDFWEKSTKIKKRFWSRSLVKSRQKNWRKSRSRETEVGEKIAVTKLGKM